MEQQAVGAAGVGALRGPERRGLNWWVRRILTWSALAVIGLILLLFFEASFGHDGLLCELGWDSDGAGEITSGCGGFWTDEY
ncbi:hypothetical protein NF556_12600 [Ornithinimicrobium faecis]|uniref:Uncharacterized protein n=1 Tax=Ornithinimicrobium faecis TaxID=2934158 RepID=A0ABY4YQQ6_9MICO|nr:hypothetical protein [Ornithinimicrobium sp. HY1793]USQ78477.1 hypothetical protein NF556_12600 [Ornithinimicrobium sp. HY1793]